MCVYVDPTNRCFGVGCCLLIYGGLDKGQRQIDKFKFRFY